MIIIDYVKKRTYRCVERNKSGQDLTESSRQVEGCRSDPDVSPGSRIL